MRDQGIGSWTGRRAGKTPDRPALRFRDRQWTYRELHERCTRLAAGLRGRGVARGDRVAYLGPNHPAFLESLFATGRLGAIFVPLNARLAGAELTALLADCQARLLVYAPERADILPAVRAQVPGLDCVPLAGPAGGGPNYPALQATEPDGPIDEPVGAQDPFLLMYTSGTTGRPKGALLSHGNITWNSLNVLVDADLAGDEVTLVVAPLFHTAGLNMTCLPTLLKGGLVVLEPAFDPARALALIEAQRVTFMFGVPAIYDALAATPRWPEADLSSLRTLMCGGAPVPAATIRTYLDRGLAFVQGYGMTEAAPGTLLLDRAQVRSKAGSAGVPHFFTEVRVVRPDGSTCAPGEKGEIVVRGPNVMSGYWRQPAATAEALDPAGWFHSGDIAYADADGYVHVVDRMKDMIISGGENVYPAEVENVLVDHPAVAEAAVLGVPDPRWGEVGLAMVVLRPDHAAGADELLGFLRGRIANYKIPKSVRFVDALPRSAAGKILKNRLREQEGLT